MGSDMGEMWDSVKAEGQEKRARNREQSAALLEKRGIAFETKNAGAHLIVRHNSKVVDFWPGTGKWIVRGAMARKGRGVFKLLRFLQA